ncbi:MAG: UDP-N-acetylglucosamine 1-carboxyvinyltransferase [bacterium]
MDKIVINGAKPLKGQVRISGAKNAVLPMMAATILASDKFEIHNVPDLRDVKTMAHLLRIIGARVEFNNNTISIDTSPCNFFEAPYELVKTMRASIYVLGPLLARFLQAKVSLPGGCALGARPVDLHLKGLEKLGAEIRLDKGYIIAKSRRLRGSQINFDFSSVGATGNLLMAAVLAEGETVMENAAREPEISALADFLVTMGADIRGIGTGRLQIRGVKTLQPVKYTVIPDRIETGTYLLAASITGGEVELTQVEPKFVASLLSKLRESGVFIEVGETTIYCKAPERLKAVHITTAPYPGFPTDLQAQWMSLMCVASGSCMITDTVFVDRFTHVAELRRLGAQIELKKNDAVVSGVEELYGAPVMSTDLRASACLILAGLKAQGRTDVLRVYHIDRGYEKIEGKLKGLGADIWREEGSA